MVKPKGGESGQIRALVKVGFDKVKSQCRGHGSFGFMCMWWVVLSWPGFSSGGGGLSVSNGTDFKQRSINQEFFFFSSVLAKRYRVIIILLEDRNM